ncbi:MAG: cadherin-like domain-containing protein [Saprospiraceae bacterium]|nr:cadherin-like domain-containing protein [Saprospiraceae bacterium]
MKFKFILFASLLACMSIVQDGISQVTAVKYQIRYNTTNCRYDCYIIITGGSATLSAHRAQFNAQYSIIVPTGSTFSVAQNYMPLQNNQTYTGVTPLKWAIGSTVFAPAAQPGSDFYSITPTLSPTSFYNNLATGDTVRIFSLAISPVTNCGSGIRIFENGVDPGSSAPGMGGGDFSNGFTIGGVGQKYTGNLPNVNPPKPVLSAVTACSKGVEVDLTATTSTCQSPLTYVWSGPNGYSATTQDVNINPSTELNNGLYQVTVSDSRGCSSTLNISAITKPNAGADQAGCQSTTTTLIGTNPSTGTWSALGTNGSGATLGVQTGGNIGVSFDATASGNYKFKYTNGGCSDTVSVNIIVPDAGQDPSTVGCFSSGTASMSATGTGVWSLSNLSAGTATIANVNNPNTTVTAFSQAGIYFLVWTNGGCTDIAQITVLDNCTCLVTNNGLTPLSTNTFCSNSGVLNIDGGAATPSGGLYFWQYSLNGNTFASAPGTSNLEDYSTPDLSTGNHRFRRIYNTVSDPICRDTSNIITIVVNTNPASPSNLVANPNPVCLGNTVSLSVTNNPGATYTWSSSNSANAGLTPSTSATTTMTPLQSGTYVVSVTQTSGGCTSAPATVSLVVSDAPPTPNGATVSGVNPLVCSGNNGKIVFTGLPINVVFTLNYAKNNIAATASITSNGSGIAELTGLTAGSYSNFSLTNAANCSSGVYAGPVVLTDPNAPNAPANITSNPNPTCLGPVIAISVTNNPGATYTWTVVPASAGLSASTTNSVTFNPPISGFYTINVVQTVSGCVSAATSTGISINNTPPTPTSLSVTSTNPSACGGANGTISLSGLINLTTYSFTYSKNTVPVTVSVTTSGSGVALINNLTQGSYTNFSITNITNCTSGVYPGPVVLSDPTTPPVPTNLTAVPNPVCLGLSVALNVQNQAGASFNWTASPSIGAGLVTSATNTTSMLPTVAGTYAINVTQTIAGCTSNPATINVVVNPTPPTPTGASVTSSNPTACAGTNGSISLSGLPASTAFVINYSKNGQPVIFNTTSSNSGLITIPNLTSGSYTNFSIVSTLNCASGVYPGPVILTDPNAPAIPANLTAVPNPVCAGTTVNLSVTNNAGATYTWTASPANSGLVASSTNTTTMVTNVSGSYIINVTQTVGACISQPATVTIIVNPNPPTPTAASITSTNPTTCGGVDGSISLSGLTASTSFTIDYVKNGNPVSIILPTSPSGVATIPNLGSGIYTAFKVTSAQNCSSGVYNGNITLSDPGAPPAPANLTALPNPVCLGTTVNLSVTNNPGAMYTWSISPLNSGLVSSTTNSTTMLAPTPGSYIVSVFQNVAGCISSAATVTVIVNPIPPVISAANFSGNNPTTCGGSNGSIVLIGLPANSSYTLNYKKNNIAASVAVLTDGTGSFTLTGLNAATYSDFSLTSAGGCSSNVYAGPIVLTDPNSPAPPTGLDAVPNPVCLGFSVSLSAINNPGATYAWSTASGQAGLIPSTTNLTSMTPTIAGDYVVSVTQSVAGCISTAATINVTIFPLPPTPTANSMTSTNPTTCLGSDGTISFNGLLINASYTINYNKNSVPVTVTVVANGAGVAKILNLAAGTYTNFMITNIQGCSSGVFNGPIVLTDPTNQQIPANLTAIPNPACLGTQVALNVTNNLGATYNWQASSSAAGLIASVNNQASMLATQPGTYVISVTQTVSGCVSQPATINVVINPLPPTPDPNNISSVNPTCDNSDGSISLSGLLPNETYTLFYKFNNASNNRLITANPNGVLILTGLVGGTYSDFSLSNSQGCLSGIFAGPIDLLAPGLPLAPLGLESFPEHICLRSMVNLFVEDTPGAIFNWSASGVGAGLASSTTHTNTMQPLAAGIFTISVTQTINGCISPAATLDLEVRADCYNPDFDVTYVSIPLTGNLSTNDSPNSENRYGDGSALFGNPSPCMPLVYSDGSYSFVCSVPGDYHFMVPVCNSNNPNMCDNVAFQITVLEPFAPNVPPIVNHDYVRTKMNTPISINMRSNDRCQSLPNCTLDNPTIVTSPLNGIFNASTSIYKPTIGFIGRDSIKYRVCQTPSVTPVNCEEAWIYITVLSNGAPNVTNAMDDYGQTPLNTPLIMSAAKGLKSNDTDPEGDAQVITTQNVLIAGKGNITIMTDGSYIFSPLLNFSGPVDCPYETCDSNDPTACDLATLHILVEPLNPTGSIGNYVWHDSNGDGVQNPAEQGVQNVTVRLYTRSGTLVGTKVTNGLGAYLFENVLAGDYYLKFSTPAQYNFTFANRGDDTRDSDVDNGNGAGTTSYITLEPGEQNNTVDAGVYICAPIGDLVWYDTNKNDRWETNENGINGLKVNLWRNHFGTWIVWDYKFTGHKPGTPSDDGYFNFCAPPGQYYIEVTLPPLGLVRAVADVGNDEEIDSDINNSNGVGTSASFTVTSGQSMLSLGAGYYPEAIVGNLVWRDDNMNGIQESGEAKMAGVLVEAVAVATGAVLRSSITDSDGTYVMDELEKKEIYLRFTPPAGFGATLPRAGSNDAKDSDVDHSYGPNTTRMFSMQPAMLNNNIDMGLAFGPLPVRWLDVSVKREKNEHLVSWSTVGEVNVAYYLLERKFETDKEFKVLPGKVDAIGNSTVLSRYNLTDFDVEKSGVYIYRVKQIDFDGQFTYSKSVKINNSGQAGIQVYPNPATSETTLDLNLTNESEIKIELYDATSKLIKIISKSNLVDAGQHQYKINLDGLRYGVYTIVVQIDNQKLYQKLIKID